MQQQQQRNQHDSLEAPPKIDTDGQSDEYVAPRTTGEWIWDNNPHEDRPEEWKKK